jgi:hypothetical protein
LKDHLDPQAIEIAEQHKFLLRIQHEGEVNFVADLKMNTTYCHFVCTSCKKSTNDTHLRSQFIRGIRDNDIRERLLQQKEDVTFAKVVELALAIETAKLESRQIQNPRSEANVHQVSTRSEPSGYCSKRNETHKSAFAVVMRHTKLINANTSMQFAASVTQRGIYKPSV